MPLKGYLRLRFGGGGVVFGRAYYWGGSYYRNFTVFNLVFRSYVSTINISAVLKVMCSQETEFLKWDVREKSDIFSMGKEKHFFTTSCLKIIFRKMFKIRILKPFTIPLIYDLL